MNPEETEIESVEIMTIDSKVIMAQESAMIDRQIATAKAYPRNIRQATENSIAIATMDKATAESCHYNVPRGGKQISGPSVNLAKIIAQCWGNMRIQARVVDIDAKHVTSQATCFDLETNLAIQVEVKRSIMQNEYVWKDGKSIRTGKMVRMSDDMITVTGNAGNSIALRNAVFNVVPKSVVNRVYGSAKQLILGDVSDETKFLKKRKDIFDACRDAYNITDAEILAALGRASMNHVTSDDLVNLVGIGTAIREGDTTIEQAFKNVNTNKKKNIAGDIIDEETKNKDTAAATTKEPEKSDEPAGISAQVRKKIGDTANDEVLIDYANNQTHLHGNEEFKKMVKDKLTALKSTSPKKLLF